MSDEFKITSINSRLGKRIEFARACVRQYESNKVIFDSKVDKPEFTYRFLKHGKAANFVSLPRVKQYTFWNEPFVELPLGWMLILNLRLFNKKEP